MFYSWGTKSDQWAMPDGHTVIARYRYFALMFIFGFAYKTNWFVINSDRNQDQQLTRQQLVDRYGSETPQLGLWTRFGLGLSIAAFAVYAMLHTAIF